MGTLKLRRRRAALAAGLATLAIGAGLAAAPAHAAPARSAIAYVALGDSYAAGQGAEHYTDTTAPACFVSKKGYPVLGDRTQDVELVANLACSGKTTQDVIDLQLPRLTPTAKLLTITAGGNDLNVGAVVVACGGGLQTPGCGPALQTAQANLALIPERVGTLILAAHAVAPEAKIVVTGYPHLFEPSIDALPATANTFVDALNASIAGAAAATSRLGVNTQYVDVAPAFAGHGLGSKEPWINLDLSDGLTPDDYHPNAKGYRSGYFESLKAAGVYTAP
ncbi:SGNH/GDSL hydrolase family protein [Pseudarthrobacter sp. O4]|uniref:SGNH/GDSL hydrolase family protein n=1 Tax=Pseudarthrobacter sp. O4 TaxID=3418417 RepID=UPI003CEEC102